MKNGVLASVFVLLAVGVAACAAKMGKVDAPGLQGPRTGMHPLRATIVMRRNPADSTKCEAQTMPKRIQVDPHEDDGVIWVIRQRPGAKCLPTDVDLELRWTAENPTKCVKLGTHTSKNKTMFECDLDQFLPGKIYTYKLFRVGGALNELVEDPDIEIVVF